MWVCTSETQHFDESLLGMEMCVWVMSILCVLTFGADALVWASDIYVCVCVCATWWRTLFCLWRVVWGILRRFCPEGGWIVRVLYSDVISPDNGLVKAGILGALSCFDCEGQLWRNGHYLHVSGSIKKPPLPGLPPVLGFPQWTGHEWSMYRSRKCAEHWNTALNDWICSNLSGVIVKEQVVPCRASYLEHWLEKLKLHVWI